MKRREFVTYSILSGAVLSFLPFGYLGASRKVEVIKINSGLPHVRHGHLYFEKAFIRSACPWLKAIKQDTFLKAEYAVNNDDLKHICIETDQEVIGIGLQGDNLLLNVNGTSYPVLNDLDVTLASGKRILYINNSEDDHLLVERSSLIVPIRGNLKINDQFISSDESVWVDNDHSKIYNQGFTQYFIIYS